jgi:hypothetical protein
MDEREQEHSDALRAWQAAGENARQHVGQLQQDMAELTSSSGVQRVMSFAAAMPVRPPDLIVKEITAPESRTPSPLQGVFSAVRSHCAQWLPAPRVRITTR